MRFKFFTYLKHFDWKVIWKFMDYNVQTLKLLKLENKFDLSDLRYNIFNNCSFFKKSCGSLNLLINPSNDLTKRKFYMTSSNIMT